MAQLSFDLDWLEAESVKGPELAATWASLRIQAGSSTVTLALDERAKTVREHLCVSLYPMAEWLATNWWFLTSEVASPIKRDDAGFRHRHSLAANREGYAYPDLHVFPLGSLTRLVWRCVDVPWAKTRLLNAGDLLLDSAEFREVCGDFVDSVVARLVCLGVEDTLLQQEWEAVRATDADEVDFCRVAAGLGWDPYAIDDAKREQVFMLAARFGNMLAEAVPVLNADCVVDGWTIIEQAIEEARRCNTLRLRRLTPLQSRISGQDSARYPWQAGYELARELRKELRLDGEPIPTMEALAQALDSEAIDAATTRVHVDGGSAILVDGLVTSGEDAPAFAFRPRGENGRRFHFCRALAEVIMRPHTDALLTPARTDRQQCNRAFAAEFLAPSAGLRRRVQRTTLDEDDVSELATEYGVSSFVIAHQLNNHRIADVVDEHRTDRGGPNQAADDLQAAWEVLLERIRDAGIDPIDVGL